MQDRYKWSENFDKRLHCMSYC